MSENIIRSDLIYLLALLQAIQKILRFSKDIDSVEDFLLDDMLVVNGCLQQFAYMGENIKKINPLTKDRHPQVPWVAIKNFRNNIVHEYQNIDLNKVLSIIKNDLNVLETDFYHVLRSELENGSIPKDHYEVAKNSGYYLCIDFGRIDLS